MSLDKVGNNGLNDYYQANKVQVNPDALVADLSETKEKLEQVGNQIGDDVFEGLFNLEDAQFEFSDVTVDEFKFEAPGETINIEDGKFDFGEEDTWELLKEQAEGLKAPSDD